MEVHNSQVGGRNITKIIQYINQNKTTTPTKQTNERINADNIKLNKLSKKGLKHILVSAFTTAGLCKKFKGIKYQDKLKQVRYFFHSFLKIVAAFLNISHCYCFSVLLKVL